MARAVVVGVAALVAAAHVATAATAAVVEAARHRIKNRRLL